MRLHWDPHPTFTGLPAYKANASQADIDAANARMRKLYERYATSLDTHHPLWHFEILTIANPPRELADLAQERRDREGKS